MWYIVRTFVNPTMYPHPTQQWKTKKQHTLPAMVTHFCNPSMWNAEARGLGVWG
jgi:hypothetical protein